MSQVSAQERPGGIGYLVVMLSIAIAGWFVPRVSTSIEPRFAVDPMFPEEDRLAAVWSRDLALGEAHPLDARAQQAVAVLENFGVVEARAGGNWKDDAYRQATKETTNALNTYWFERGEESFRALGFHLTERFERAILAVLARIRSEKTGVLEWLKSNASDPLAVELYEVGGNFLSMAHRWGIVSTSGRLIGDSRALLRLHYKLRFLRFVNDIDDYTHLLDPEELRAIWRWRVSGDQSQKTSSRVAFAHQLRGIDSSFPIYEVLGGLMAGDGRDKEAIAYYREALLDNPFDGQVVANLSALLARVEPAEPSSTKP